MKPPRPRLHCRRSAPRKKKLFFFHLINELHITLISCTCSILPSFNSLTNGSVEPSFYKSNFN